MSEQMNRDQIGAAIAEKAWKDDEFRRAVLADANKIYEEKTGKRLPPGLTIKVLEDTETTIHFVIPARSVETGELTDAELERVAGGTQVTAPAPEFYLTVYMGNRGRW